MTDSYLMTENTLIMKAKIMMANKILILKMGDQSLPNESILVKMELGSSTSICLFSFEKTEEA